MLHDSTYRPAGQDRLFTAIAVVSSNCPTELDPLAPQTSPHVIPLNPDAFLGQVGQRYDAYYHAWFFANTLRVHYAAQPLPKFGAGWVYGDIHYHSQGTDNEGESGISYRAVMQTMKAMGLDFIIASDHASSGIQLTDIDNIFVDQLPDDLPYLPDWQWIKDKILAMLAGIRIPVETSHDTARDMNPRRWKYLLDWLNNPGDGVNRQVLSGGGRACRRSSSAARWTRSRRSRRPTASPALRVRRRSPLFWPSTLHRHAVGVPHAGQVHHLRHLPRRDALLVAASEGGRYKLKDVQGLARQLLRPPALHQHPARSHSPGRLRRQRHLAVRRRLHPPQGLPGRGFWRAGQGLHLLGPSGRGGRGQRRLAPGPGHRAVLGHAAQTAFGRRRSSACSCGTRTRHLEQARHARFP